MLIVKITSKRLPACPGCGFSVETEDGRVYCGNNKCTWYLQTTTCKCPWRESLSYAGSDKGAFDGFKGGVIL